MVWMVGQLIQNLVWIFPNGSTTNTKPCLDTSKWWVNGPSKTIWMDLNGSTACYQHCSNGITMCVQNQWAFLKLEILNGFKWSISRRVKLLNYCLKTNLIWNWWTNIMRNDSIWHAAGCLRKFYVDHRHDSFSTLEWMQSNLEAFSLFSY